MFNLTRIGSLIFFAVAGSTAYSVTAQADCGKADVVKGKVDIKHANGTMAALAIGTEVCTGDVVTTAADSRAKLIMPGNNMLNINPDSRIKIEAYEHKPNAGKKKVLLNVMYGKMRATVNTKYDGKSSEGEPQLFQVKTKSAVAGVRGTDFLTSFNKASNKMQVVTFEGRVEVGQAGPGGAILNSVKVDPGTKTEVMRGEPPAPPKPVPAAELHDLNTQSQAAPSTANTSSGESGGTTEKGDNEKKDAKNAKGDANGSGNGKGQANQAGSSDSRGGAETGAGEGSGERTAASNPNDGDRAPASSVAGSSPAGPGAEAPSGPASGMGAPPPGFDSNTMPIDSHDLIGGQVGDTMIANPSVQLPPLIPVIAPVQLPTPPPGAISSGPSRVNISIQIGQ